MVGFGVRALVDLTELVDLAELFLGVLVDFFALVVLVVVCVVVGL